MNTTLVMIPKMRSGIIVRIVFPATTNADAIKPPAPDASPDISEAILDISAMAHQPVLDNPRSGQADPINQWHPDSVLKSRSLGLRARSPFTAAPVRPRPRSGPWLRRLVRAREETGTGFSPPQHRRTRRSAASLHGPSPHISSTRCPYMLHP